MLNDARNNDAAIARRADHDGPLRGSDRTLVDQTAAWMKQRIDERLFRAGTRVPSIRMLAIQRGISRFTVVEAYERLVAHGYLESKRGSGFYVRERAGSATASSHGRHRSLSRHSMQATSAPTDASQLDAQWLVRNMFRDLPPHHMPGSGLPPPGWMDGDMLATSLRAVGRAMCGPSARSSATGVLDYGKPQGFLPLREELQRKLTGFDIGADPSQIVMTSGATQAFDLIARQFVSPGDTVLVDDPAWFLMFGLFAAHGARVVGVPRLADGPDLAILENLVIEHKPRFYVVDSVLHNPTSTSLSSAKAFQILKLAELHDFAVIEDDVYGDLHPGSRSGRNGAAIRLASLDQLKRVIYVGSFSKTLAANLRVGFVACNAELAQNFADHKMLVALTTPEIGERMVWRILSEGHYRKHVDRLRARFDAARDRAIRGLERVGLTIDHQPAAGMFLWARAGGSGSGHARGGGGPNARGIDTNALAARLFDEGYLLAPGSLFSPSQLPSSHLRFNIATSSNPGMLDALAHALQTMA
ncbi:MAG: PLP-dependent aminotransferase family protein [Burkholderiaceae bacterium]